MTLYDKIKEKYGKPKQILFNTEMVRAILDGQKTQTRRPIKAPGNEYHYEKLLCDWPLSCKPEIIEDELHWELQTAVDDSGTYTEKLLYQPGDILYVRETFADISETEPGNIHYKASANEEDLEWFNENGWNWKPSIHMPKELARIFLKVTDVRVERLQEIAPEDFVAEGNKCCKDCLDHYGCALPEVCAYLPEAMKKLWDPIYKEKGYGWEENPYVWVIEFEVSEIEK
jgi:hypothetical protein